MCWLARLQLLLAALAAAALAGADLAAAEERSVASIPEPPLGAPVEPATAPFRLRLLLENAPNAGFDGADVSWLRSGARLLVGGPVSERVEVNLRLAGEFVEFDVSGDESFLDTGRPGAPFDDLIESSVRLGAGFRVREKWQVVGEGYLQSKLEQDADVGDSLKGGVVLGAGYRRSTDLRVLFGVKLGTRLDRSGLYPLPILRVGWQIDDRWRFDFNNGDFQLEHELSEHWGISASAAFQTDRFRLADRDDGPAGVGEGSLAHWRVPVRLGVEWRPSARWSVRVSGGAIAWQHLDVNDEDADDFDSVTADRAAPFAGLEVTARF